jgi:hypothetical protein
MGAAHQCAHLGLVPPLKARRLSHESHATEECGIDVVAAHDRIVSLVVCLRFCGLVM